MNPITNELKYISLTYNSQERKLYLKGDNKWVKGEISISYRYLYSVLVIILRVFRMRKKLK